MSRKNNDQKGRFRDLTIAFRVSKKENEILERHVALTGLNKQDYLIANMLNQSLIVHGNPKVFRSFKNELGVIVAELKRIEDINQDNDEIIELTNNALNLLNKLTNLPGGTE